MSHIHNRIVVDIGFSPSVYSVNEDDGSVEFVIQNRNPNMERDVVVEFMTTDGTALGNDTCMLYLLHLPPHNRIYTHIIHALWFCRRR